MSNDYEKMSVLELEKKLNELKGRLEDLVKERAFVLGQTGLHISSSTVKKFEIEINEINENIELFEALLKSTDVL